MKNNRIYNFGAGPGMLPEVVLKEAQDELLDWQGKGLSILEIGHRTKDFVSFMHKMEETLRKLMRIPSNYKVLFLGGPARLQFAMISLNFLHKNEKAGFIVSGIWSDLALQETLKLKDAYTVASSKENSFSSIPLEDTWQIQENSKYIYYTPNETINGVSFQKVPQVKNIPLIADLTSCMLAEPIDITKYALVFAGAQKNISGAGLTIVIIRDDLLNIVPDEVIPTMLDYRVHIENNSLYATPPVFNCYLAEKTFNWINAQGGVEKIYEMNKQKAKILYDYIDSSSVYYSVVTKENRSIINICFYLHKKELEEKFLIQAERCGLYALKGHRKVGGFRASLYNAMPKEGVEKLVQFMDKFAKDNHL